MEALLAATAELRTCDSAESALALLATWDADVICADYGLPGMDGLSLLRKVAPETGHTRGLLITGSEEYFRISKRQGWFVLLKPFDPDRLQATVQHLARLSAMRRSVGSTRERLGLEKK